MDTSSIVADSIELDARTRLESIMIIKHTLSLLEFPLPSFLLLLDEPLQPLSSWATWKTRKTGIPFLVLQMLHQEVE